MNSEQVANILAFYSYYHPSETVDEIALDFKIPIANIVNGLYYGDRNKFFEVKKKGPQYKNIIVTAIPDTNSEFGKDVERIKGIVYETVTNLNSDQEDITDDNLYIWLGVPLIIAKVVLQLLLNENKLVKYYATDPKDPESKYCFYTLPENNKKYYGRKQFRIIKKKDIKQDESVSEK